MAAALAKPTTRRWIAVYITSSLLLLSLEFIRIWSKSEDTRLSIFIKSRCVTRCNAQTLWSVIPLHRKHPYYLNGRFIFLVLAQVWLSISFALRDVMLERFVFRWAKALPSSNAVSLFVRILFTPHDTTRSAFCTEKSRHAFAYQHTLHVFIVRSL